MLRFPLIILLVLCATASFAQSKKKRNTKNIENTQQQSSSLSPYFPSKDYEPEKKGKTKSKSRKATYNAMDKHEDQMRAVVKANRKAEKEMLKPQYSDPSYFGHKHKPKKHKPGKIKFCKECEIRH